MQRLKVLFPHILRMNHCRMQILIHCQQPYYHQCVVYQSDGWTDILNTYDMRSEGHTVGLCVGCEDGYISESCVDGELEVGNIVCDDAGSRFEGNEVKISDG